MLNVVHLRGFPCRISCRAIGQNHIRRATLLSIQIRPWRRTSLGITECKNADLIIGTFCIERGHTLLHADRDFAPMERYLGLAVV